MPIKINLSYIANKMIYMVDRKKNKINRPSGDLLGLSSGPQPTLEHKAGLRDVY